MRRSIGIVLSVSSESKRIMYVIECMYSLASGAVKEVNRSFHHQRP